MLENLPFGQTPIGKSKYAFDDIPDLAQKRWQSVNGEYIDDGIEISYIGNSSGYRTKEWKEINWKKCIIFLGDSATYGHGSAEIHTIPKIIEKETGIECVNMAIPGASSELLINISCVLINELNPKNVVLGHPSMPRLWDPISSTGNLGPWLEYAKGFAKESYELYDAWMKVKQRQIHKCSTNTLTLRTLWKHTKLIEWTWDEAVAELIQTPYYKYLGHTAENLSRDGYHANKNIHTIIAQEIIKCF
jgi:hypothetical protein